MQQPCGHTIAIMHYAGPPIVGGVESVMRHHAQLLSALGHQVRLIVGRGETWRKDIPVNCLERIDSLHPDALTIKKSLDTGVVPANFEAFSSQIESDLQSALSDVDVLIVHNICTMAKNLALTAALRRITQQRPQMKVIAWHHDLAFTADRYKDELHQGYPWSLLAEPWNDVPMQHVAVSKMRQEELTALQGIPASEVQVIPSGVSYSDFYQLDDTTSTLLSELNLDAYFPVFLLPVRITKRKNIEFALEVVAAMRSQFPQAALVVTGPPGAHNSDNSSYFDFLRAERTRLALDPNPEKTPSETTSCAFFLAEVLQSRLSDQAIAGLFRFCDALLMPSAEEGFGIPLIEAGLSGMPVFCSDIAPFKEIANGDAHFFSLEHAPEDIAAHIAKTITSSPTLRLRKKVRQEYSWNAVVRSKILPLLNKSTGRHEPNAQPSPESLHAQAATAEKRECDSAA